MRIRLLLSGRPAKTARGPAVIVALCEGRCLESKWRRAWSATNGATERRREVTNLEAERRAMVLQERSSELEPFAGRVAHDIVSPLMAVGIGLQLSKQRLAGDPAAVTTIDRANGSLMRVRRIVVGLLDFARAGARPDANARGDLREAAQGVVDDVRGESEAASVELVVEPFADRARACSPGVLSSLIGNLVRNAIKYMGDSESRRVTLRVGGSDDIVRVEVEDTGPGIAAEIREAIFEPFFRGGESSVAGAGIGLATVKKLAHSHAGRAGCRSEVGRGSVFWVELPAATAPDSSIAIVGATRSHLAS
jgi:signal transduction histidine kinase